MKLTNGTLVQSMHEGRLQTEVGQPDVPVEHKVVSHDDDYLILETHKEGRMIVATKHLLSVEAGMVNWEKAVFCNMNDVPDGKKLADEDGE